MRVTALHKLTFPAERSDGDLGTILTILLLSSVVTEKVHG